MNQISKELLIFSLALMVAITGCKTSEKQVTVGDSATGGTGQANSTTVVNKPAESNSVANKTTIDKKVLWDFREADEYKSQQISKAETAAVVKYLFGDQTNSKIEIRDRISGSFTKSNAKETLYYLTGCKDEESDQFTTDCPHVSWDSIGWIAIYDGTTPVLKLNEALGNRIGKVTDVNGDGINEILSFGGYGQSGIQTQTIALGQISGNKYQAIKEFDGYADNCAFGGGKSANELSAKAAVVSYVAADGKMPEFSEEYFQGQCNNDEADKSSWKVTTKKDFNDFFDSLS